MLRDYRRQVAFLFPFLLLPFLLWTGCRSQSCSIGSHSADAAFDALRSSHLANWKENHPLECVALGFHSLDGQFKVPNAAHLANLSHRLHQTEASLNSLPFDDLSPENRFEAQLLRHWIATELWTLETERDPWRNPMTYPSALDISVYLKRDWKPWVERVRDLNRILGHAGEVMTAAQQNLEATLPRPFIETAIDVAEGTASFLQKDVAREVDQLADASVKAEYHRVSDRTVAVLKNYVEWLRKERLPQSTSDFALGRDGFAQRLHAEGIDLSPREVLNLGMAELRREQARFADAAKVIDPTRPANEVFKAIQKEHPTAEGLIPDTRRDLEMIRTFVLDQHLITIPSEIRATVRETLPPFRSTSFASMDTPGPYETKATEAYYYVTPVEPEWPPAQKEEWLTAFNDYTTDVVSIHEAYPGHYVQFLALNASRAGDIAKIYTSYAFVEGWAHYTEQMVVDAGFPDGPLPESATPEQRIHAAKFRLAQSDEALLRLCRLCVSIQMHTEGMSLAQGTQFFMDNCYYEAKPAASEAQRGTFDPGYCFYTLGKLQILKLRRDWQAQEGERYSPQRFHDAVVSHGAPPLVLLRQQMLHDPSLWPKIL